MWARGAAGSALESHSRGQGFESPRVHHPKILWPSGPVVDLQPRNLILQVRSHPPTRSTFPLVPPLVIVCGPPAVGKTILATALGEQLGMPVISKDLVKEAMMDHLGGAPAVGAAAFAVEFAIARELLKSEIGVILEGAFFRDQVEITELAALGDPIVLNLSCSLDVLEQRYIERHWLRHPSHRGLEAVPDLRDRIEAGSYGVPELHGSALSVVTTRGFEPPEEEVVRWVREQIAAMSQSTRGGDNQGPIRDEPAGRIDSELIWEQQTPEWIQWARKPGHDSYWRFRVLRSPASTRATHGRSRLR